MKKILTTLSQKWSEYLIESVVIVASILGAYSLDDWGENRARKSQEIEILKGCKAELTIDLMDIQVNVKNLTTCLNSLDLIIDALESDLPYHDSLARHFNFTILPIRFINSTSNFEVLKSKGFDLISNPEIRLRLIALYDSQYEFFAQGEAQQLEQVLYGFRHILPYRFNSGWDFSKGFEGVMIPLDYEALKKDEEYLYYIRTQRNRSKGFKNYFYKNLQNSVESMISELDEELNRLQS